MTEPDTRSPAWGAGNGATPNSTLGQYKGHQGKGSVLDQYKALVIRNLIMKKRDKRRTVTEFVMPVYFIVILALIRLGVRDTKYDAVVDPHGQAQLLPSLVLLNATTLHVAPDSQQSKKIMESVQQMADVVDIELDMNYYPTEENITSAFNNSMKVAVVFGDAPDGKTYTLRFNPLTTPLPPPTTLKSGGAECRAHAGSTLQGAGCTPNGYYFSGFSALQTLIDTAIIKLSTGKDTLLPPSVLLQNMPRDEFQSDGGMVLRNIVPLYMVFAWAQFIVYMLMLVVEEKEKKIKESMKMMGLRDTVYWLSWFTVYGAYVLVLALICIILLPLAGVFRQANVFLLFILFILYGCSSIMFSFMLTPFFNKAKVAGVAGNLIQVALSLLFYLQVYLGTDLDAGVFWALALLSPCAFSMAIDKTIMFDYSDVGLSYSRLWDGPGLPFAGSLIMISIDIVIYLFLAYYLDNVVPSEYGTKQKPWFLFQKSFWMGKDSSFQFVSLNSSDNQAYDETDVPDNPDVEPVPSHMKKKVAVRIRNLRKTYHSRGKDPVNAVDGFSLDIYEGQITAILGHNGAGKTTLFNVLTGMTSLTEGAASVFGMDISDPNDLTELRRITGVCPQHDVVFMKLTPLEHLRYFAQIRGVQADKLDEVVEQTLKEVDLYSKRNSLAMDLSGGQKRKLSIGIAIIGDPKIIFLDEPTAGVDAYSRRKLWGLLKNRKEGKVILLTTHFMDEADILADRKAIMSQGRLRCCGTSLFLKNKFGLGYHLTLVVSESVVPETITGELQKTITDVQMVRFYGKEMSFLLPSNSATQFPMLFSLLDKYISNPDINIGIEGYGISMTTLEEVFLTLNDENEGGDLKSIDNLGQQMIQERSPSASPIHQASSVQPAMEQNGVDTKTADVAGFAIDAVEVKRDEWRAFKSLLWVRTIGTLREPAAVVFLILFPLGFTIGSIALADSQSIPIATDRHLVLNTDMYSNIPGALLHNSTTHLLQDLEASFTASNMALSAFSGNYSDLSEDWNHFTAFDVASFYQSGDPMESANLTLLFNDTFMHSIPILVNILNNAVLSAMGGNGNISVSSQFLPAFKSEITFDASSFFAPMMIGFTFTLVPAGLTMDLVMDREVNQNKEHASSKWRGFNLYFASYLVVMIILYMIAYIGLLIIIQAFAVASLIIGPAYAAIAILYFLYMPCAMLSNAAASYAFDKSETARQFYPSIVTTLGFVAYTVVSMVDLFVTPSSVAVILHVVFTVLCPVYIPFGLLYYINKIYIDCSILGSCDDLTANDYMTPEIIVLFVMLILDIPLYYVILRVADTVKLGGSWREALWLAKPKVGDWDMEGGVDAPLGEDDDVVRERENVAAALQDPSCTSPVLIYDLGKSYKQTVDEGERRNPCKRGEENTFVALKSVSLEVKSGQVFGLLGPNGAGKTTSLRIMTAEERPSKGRVQMCGEDVLSSLSKVFETMGYCPQHDSLWRNITVAEHIQCYADIRGVREDQVKHLVNAYLKGLEVEEHRDKKSKDCSGGTKRKLSYIMSMLGRPQVVLLDEPSTGMDPKSKRFLWNSILASFRGERSAILTTHSMEEADALCSTIGILVRGGMRCIGPIQHLKNKYGGGYSLEVKLNQQHRPSVSVTDVQSSSHASPARELSSNNKNQVKEMITGTFPNAVLDEEFEERMVYKVPQDDVKSLANCFDILEKAKTDGLVEEYALSQTTLEQVFLQFARQQEEEDIDEEEKEDEV